jgi:hypothetical protein
VQTSSLSCSGAGAGCNLDWLTCKHATFVPAFVHAIALFLAKQLEEFREQLTHRREMMGTPSKAQDIGRREQRQ